MYSEIIKGAYKYVPYETDWYILDDNGLWKFISKLDDFSFDIRMRYNLDANTFVDHHKHLSLHELHKRIDCEFRNRYGLEYMLSYSRYYWGVGEWE